MVKGFTCCRSGEAAVGRVALETTKNAATAAAAAACIAGSSSRRSDFYKNEKNRLVV